MRCHAHPDDRLILSMHNRKDRVFSLGYGYRTVLGPRNKVQEIGIKEEYCEFVRIRAPVHRIPPLFMVLLEWDCAWTKLT